MESGYIPKANKSVVDAINQQVILQWKNLSVYVSFQKQKEQISSSKVALVEELQSVSSKRTQTTSQQQNERALALSTGKYKYKCILSNQNGYALPGELTAVMGPSGAGKTTFIAAITQRLVASQKTIIDGSFFANGEKITSKQFTSFGAFVMQNDVLMSTMTVRGIILLLKNQESIMFSACLRLRVSEQEKQNRVDKLIQDLQLQNCQHNYIGDILLKGISGGERKRTSIGVELISDPNVIVLDEPTSGLDSFTSFILIDILQKIAKTQMRTILFTIHQPSADIFQKFDKLILLSYGRTAYQGEANQLVNYMKKIGDEIPKFCNPCDYFMNQLRDPNSKLTPEEFLNHDISDLTLLSPPMMQSNCILKRRVSNSFSYEFNKLTRRQLNRYIRSPTLLKARCFTVSKIFQTIFLSVLYFHSFFKQAPSQNNNNQNDVQSYAQGITGCLYFITLNTINQGMQSLLVTFPIEREIFLKEVNSQTYRVFSYFFAKMISEVPILIITTIIQFGFVYYFIGFQFKFVDFVLICALAGLNGNGIGLCTGSLINDAKRAAALGAQLLLPFFSFSGFQSNLTVMPAWVSWFQYVSPFKYAFEGLVRTQFEGVEYPIQSETISFQYILIQEYGLTFGLTKCILFLGITAIFFHFLAYLILSIKVTKLSV